MANAFLNMDKIANSALANLYNGTVYAHQVHRDYESDFTGASGDQVIVRKPAVFVAKTFDRTTGIEIQNATEGSLIVKIDKILDVSFAVTDEQMTWDIEQFDARLLAPAMLALVQGIDAHVAALAGDVTAVTTLEESDPKVLAQAGTILTQANVPLADRHAIVDATTYGEWITKPPFDKADTSGSTDALREAHLGRAYGFDTYQTNQPFPAVTSGVAFHKSAFALVTRTLTLPKGATGAVASHDGFGVRVTYGYDQKFKQTVVSVDLAVGAKTIDPARAVRIATKA